jgi:hypothetical protein
LKHKQLMKVFRGLCTVTKKTRRVRQRHARKSIASSPVPGAEDWPFDGEDQHRLAFRATQEPAEKPAAARIGCPTLAEISLLLALWTA